MTHYLKNKSNKYIYLPVHQGPVTDGGQQQSKLFVNITHKQNINVVYVIVLLSTWAQKPLLYSKQYNTEEADREQYDRR